MLQAMNTGHDGSLTTVHANTPRDALTRIETMISMGAMNLPERAMRQQIAVGDPARHPAVAHERRHEKGHEHLGDHRDGRRRHHDAGDLRLREARRDARKARSSAGSARPACGRRSASASRRRASTCRPTCSKASRRCGDGAADPRGHRVRVSASRLVFGTVLRRHEGAGHDAPAQAGRAPRRRSRRAEESSTTDAEDQAILQVVRRPACCPRSIGSSAGRTRGSALGRWIEQSGVKTSVSAVLLLVGRHWRHRSGSSADDADRSIRSRSSSAGRWARRFRSPI